MYKYSVPISIESVTEYSKPVFIEEFRKGNIERVFLTCLLPVYRDDSSIWTHNKQFRETVKFFKAEGFEVGIWINGLGHGAVLSHETRGNQPHNYNYQTITGVNGETLDEVFCPFDDNYVNEYLKAIREIAEFDPDLIFIDDDFRLNTRSSYTMGCCCPLHLKEYYDRIGEEIPREELETLIFSGGKNKYRSEWLKLQHDTVINFASKIRQAVDSVNENIRLGAASCFDVWDFSGTDPIELSKIFAGNTLPFFRTISPPGAFRNASCIEYTRMQAAWSKNSGVEIFAEGDVYPRPRQNVPSKVLEMFDIALLASGSVDGILKYMYCYDKDIDYEKGYTNAHIHNMALREEIKEIFNGKKSVGVRVFEHLHKLENLTLPENTQKGIAKKVEGKTFAGMAQKIVSQNAIPTTYDRANVNIICGENARYITEAELGCGAVLNVTAAKFLSERGIDTGIIASSIENYKTENFLPYNSRSAVGPVLHKMQCNPTVKVLSELLPDNDIGSYLYENAQGQRFYVLAFDDFNTPMYIPDDTYAEYFNSYYRQEQLIKAIEWIGRKPLDAVSTKNPFLYLLAAKNDNGSKMSVLLLNIYMDDIYNPVIKLDKKYSSARFVNCSGEIFENEIHLSRIEPYGIAAFEVEL